MIAILYATFVEPNCVAVSESELLQTIEDYLFRLREENEAYDESSEDPAKPASYFLAYWSADDRGWLRKFYESDGDEPLYELTPATAKAITWVQSLGQRTFVGTESRLRVLIDLLRDIGHGGSTSPEERLANLLERKRAIQEEIEELEGGNITPMTETEIKERFLHFQSLSRELLADFKEVEHNFRILDHDVRERIARWDGHKADLVEQILGERDAISDSDQGRSFSAFYKLLMNTEQQDELQGILQQVLEYDAIRNLAPGRQSRRVIDDWLSAATNTQRMIARLSKQLRRFVDEGTHHQDPRVLEIIKDIERQIYEISDKSEANGIALSIGGADINLPLDRSLFREGVSAQVQPTALVEAQDEDAETEIRPVKAIDPLVLISRLDGMLSKEHLTSLRRVIAEYPPEFGLAELLHYIHISEVLPEYEVIDDPDVDEPIDWTIEHEGSQHERRAHLQRLIIGRKEPEK